MPSSRALAFLLLALATSCSGQSLLRSQFSHTCCQLAGKCFMRNAAIEQQLLALAKENAALKKTAAQYALGGANYPASSCREILLYNRHAPSGAYYIRSGNKVEQVYCHMNSLGSCGGGGWTTLIKVDGRKSTFSFRSSYWTSSTTYNVGGGRTGFDGAQTKLNTYNSMPFTKLCVVFKNPKSSHTGHVLISKTASSLLSVIRTNSFSAFSSAGRSVWLKSIPGASLQPNCNRAGFNTVDHYSHHARARIGIIANNENHCRSSDSVVGVGVGAETKFCSCPSCRNVYAGNFNGCKGNHVLPSYAYVLAQ